MKHVLKLSEYQLANGNWMCSDVEDLGHGSGYWWIPAQMLGMKLTDYILMLKETFNATDFVYYKESGYLSYSWKSQADMRKFKNWINSKARQANYMI